MAFETMVPARGEEIDTVGWLGTEFCTLIVTGALALLLFELSVTTAVSVWLPLTSVFVFKEVVKGAAISGVPRLEPSIWNWTLLLAFADTVIVPETVAPLAGAVIVTVGDVELPPLLGLTKPEHPVLQNAKLTAPINIRTRLAPPSTAPLDIPESLIDLLKSFLINQLARHRNGQQGTSPHS